MFTLFVYVAKGFYGTTIKSVLPKSRTQLMLNWLIVIFQVSLVVKVFRVSSRFIKFVID